MTDPLLLQTLRELREAIDRNTEEQARTNAKQASTNAELAAANADMRTRLEALEHRPAPSPFVSAVVGALCMALATPVVKGVAGWINPPAPVVTTEAVRRG
jgi:hypothetical protein